VSDQPEAPEHRSHERKLVCVTIEVCPDAADKQVAMIHNMSVGGVYVLARAPLELGEKVALTIRLSVDPEGRAAETTGRVVRVDPLPLERADVWSHGIAIAFDEPLTHLEKEIEALAAVLKEADLAY